MIAVRAPSHPTSRIPEHLISQNQGRHWVQVFDPRRMPGTFGFIEALWHAGVQWVAATSMNEAGSAEIVDIEDAAEFCRRHRLPLLFESSAAHNASGSLPILELNEQGLRLDREGIIARQIWNGPSGCPSTRQHRSPRTSRPCRSRPDCSTSSRRRRRRVPSWACSTPTRSSRARTKVVVRSLGGDDDLLPGRRNGSRSQDADVQLTYYHPITERTSSETTVDDHVTDPPARDPQNQVSKCELWLRALWCAG